ncbi:PAS domain S-box protein [Svornostia abyssi]|uniref:PAS domain S-box protein n=1 Tax=Svornostia abyssi TaxID=2898438 RepID=A0ABY5PMI5_9ACTN|nr:PAS domain S-box protein [Parviterribacteraceae bacterium J379]
MVPTEDELRLFWNRSGVLFCIIDEAGRLAAVNAVWTDLLGWREDQLLGHRPQEFMHPDDLAGPRPGIAAADSERPLPERDQRFRNADGSVRWLQWTGYDRDGRWYGVGRDVTAMHTSQVALQHSERRSRATLTALREGLVITGPDGRVLELNDRFAEMTGWTAREIVGTRPPHPWWPPEDHERATALLRASTDGGHASRELTFMRRNGERFPALVDKAPLVERSEAKPSTLFVIRDITELARTRDRLRASHEVARISGWEWFTEGDRVVINYDGMRPGTPPQYEVTGDDILSVIAPEDRELARRLRDETADGTREELMVDLRVASPNIAVEWVEWRGRPLRDADGTIIGVCGTAQDISARKRVEAAATATPPPSLGHRG